MSDFVEDVHFKDLAAYDPVDVAARTHCKYNSDNNEYTIQVWGNDYKVLLNENKIISLTSNNKFHDDYLNLFILYYLMKSKNIKPSGQWVSEKDIPGGAAFFRGPHTIPTHLITHVFKNDLPEFEKICQTHLGNPIEMADKAYWFEITPHIPIAVLYWQGDEDFESEAKLLYDKTIAQHLPLDIIYAIAVKVCRILGQGKRM
ncbi:MAG: DUF3786 domain-containing protein [Desulfobacteraceae bacterium]|nr:DUF3786 domain-containing protein [Desulfobacteraceae bacterium]